MTMNIPAAAPVAGQVSLDSSQREESAPLPNSTTSQSPQDQTNRGGEEPLEFDEKHAERAATGDGAPEAVREETMVSAQSRSIDEALRILPDGGTRSKDYQTLSRSSSRNRTVLSPTTSAVHTSPNSPIRSTDDEVTTRASGKRKGKGRRRSKGDGTARVSMYKRFVDNWGSRELENKGSVARDHLALERTFLAWLRTSLAFASIGVAVAQLFRLNSSLSSSTPNTALHKLGKPLGATFLGISIIILLLGFQRYFESQHWIIKGKFPASRGSILIVTLITVGLILSSFVVILVSANHSDDL